MWHEHAREAFVQAAQASSVLRGQVDRVTRTWRRSRSEPRLVPSPVFVISPVRSGSTLLRVLLDTHPQIRAPHEMHLRNLQVSYLKDYTALAMEQLGLDRAELEQLLWDRILHRELQRSGKRVIVDKTPGNAYVWERLARTWPQARYIFLIRHPAAIAASLQAARPERPEINVTNEVLRYGEAVEAARRALPGPTVRYEDLTTDPERVVRALCRYLQVRWAPEMLAYGRRYHGPYRGGIGDWSTTIRSGRVQEPRPLPPADQLPAALVPLATGWGYLSDRPTAAPAVRANP